MSRVANVLQAWDRAYPCSVDDGMEFLVGLFHAIIGEKSTQQECNRLDQMVHFWFLNLCYIFFLGSTTIVDYFLMAHMQFGYFIFAIGNWINWTLLYH
jgi:hypothetical protein